MVSYSQANKFGQSKSIQCTQNQIRHFRQFSLRVVLFGFLLKLSVNLKKLTSK